MERFFCGDWEKGARVIAGYKGIKADIGRLSPEIDGK
jgi:hypothetical protein